MTYIVKTRKALKIEAFWRTNAGLFACLSTGEKWRKIVDLIGRSGAWMKKLFDG